jgi:hypothetical protein
MPPVEDILMLKINLWFYQSITLLSYFSLIFLFYIFNKYINFIIILIGYVTSFLGYLTRNLAY